MTETDQSDLYCLSARGSLQYLTVRIKDPAEAEKGLPIAKGYANAAHLARWMQAKFEDPTIRPSRIGSCADETEEQFFTRVVSEGCHLFLVFSGMEGAEPKWRVSRYEDNANDRDPSSHAGE